MTDRITELYQSAGVDTDSFEHKVRLLWNKSPHSRRMKHINRMQENPAFQFRRWDHLPVHMQKGVIRAIKRRLKEKKRDK